LENLKPDGLPRFSKRIPGDARRKLECEDILNFFAFVDDRQAPDGPLLHFMFRAMKTLKISSMMNLSGPMVLSSVTGTFDNGQHF